MQRSNSDIGGVSRRTGGPAHAFYSQRNVNINSVKLVHRL